MLPPINNGIRYYKELYKLKYLFFGENLKKIKGCKFSPCRAL